MAEDRSELIDPAVPPALQEVRLGGRRSSLDLILTRLPRRRLALAAGVTAIVTTVLLGLLVALRESEILEIDTAWMAEIVAHRAPWWDVPSRLFDLLGGGWIAVLVVPVGVALAFLLARRPWSALAFVVGSAGSALVVQVLKMVFGRHRPEDILIAIDSPSFPSGHTANAATIVVLLLLLLGRPWIGVVGALYVVAMALSRTYLGAHWMTDTIGGAIVGVGLAVLAWAAFEALLRHERAPRP